MNKSKQTPSMCGIKRQANLKASMGSVRHMKFTFLLVVIFITACQTVQNQDDITITTIDVLDESIGANDPVVIEQPLKTTASVPPPPVETISEQSAPVEAINKQPAPKVDKEEIPQAEYSQSHPPMSAATKNRLKTHSRELASNGSIPTINMQQSTTPTPNLMMASDEAQTETKPVPIQFNYEQVEIRQIIEEFADSLGMTIVISPDISGTITMRTAPNASFTQKDLMPLLQMMLSEASIVLEQRNGIYYAKQSDQQLPSTIGTASILDTSNASLIMQVTPLKHISIDAALTVLKPVTENSGRIIPVPNLNTLLIADTPEQLKRLNGLLSLIDSNPFKHRGIRLYKLKEAEAAKVALELKDILKIIEGNAPSHEVLGLERINALLVISPPGRGFKEVGRWIDILDSGADVELQEQIFIYKCKSLKATALADTLNAVFAKDDDDQDEDRTEARENPNEFRTVSKESLSVDALNKVEQPEPTAQTNSSRKEPSANINVTIVADEASNTLLVRTTAKDYKHLLQTIRTLDVVPLQVLINVVIAQVTLSDSQSLGIDWAYLGSSGTTLQTNFGQAQSVVNGQPLGLVVNRITNDWRVTLNALAQESDVNILSRPSLLITNNQEGVINVGQEVPVETSSTTNTNATVDDTVVVTQQIAYRKTGIELTVTPQINDDGIVSMDIKQGLSAIEGQTEGSDAGLNPTFTNQEIQTSVIVQDQETIILGGLIETVEVDGESGVPVLKDVPIVGALFKTQGDQIERRELILVISTQIVNAENDYNDFNNAFKNRYYKAAQYLDKQLAADNRDKATPKTEINQ